MLKLTLTPSVDIDLNTLLLQHTFAHLCGLFAALILLKAHDELGVTIILALNAENLKTSKTTSVILPLVDNI